MKTVKVGFVGLGHRGRGMLKTSLACEECEVVAVCDCYEDRAQDGVNIIREKRGTDATPYLNATDLINDPSVEAVVITAAWEAHTRLAVECMKAGKPVALEVAGAYDVEDCWQLVRTYEETGTPLMLLENCCFDKFELLTTALVRAGKLGRVMYCHGAYAHELRGEILGGEINRHYRLRNYQLRNCENYPTHELGPIAKLLNINRGNKMLSLTSVATKGGVSLMECANGPQCPDENQKGKEFAQGDIVVTTITCANGEVITLCLDTTMPRYYSREFTVHGTRGIAVQEGNMIFTEEDDYLHKYFDPTKVLENYMRNDERFAEYLPSIWRDITEEEKKRGHGGMDYLEFKAFYKALLNNEEMPIDVYDAAAWMCITPLSEQSVAHGGMPQPIPDFTRGAWMHRPTLDVTELPTVNAAPKGEDKNELGYSRGE